MRFGGVIRLRCWILVAAGVCFGKKVLKTIALDFFYVFRLFFLGDVYGAGQVRDAGTGLGSGKWLGIQEQVRDAGKGTGFLGDAEEKRKWMDFTDSTLSLVRTSRSRPKIFRDLCFRDI